MPMRSGSSPNYQLSSKSGFDKASKSRRTKCRCACTRAHNNKESRDGDNETVNAPSPVRGRSATPKFDRTNGNGKFYEAHPTTTVMTASCASATSSVEGEEGLANYQMEGVMQMEVDVPRSHANESIHCWLTEGSVSGHPYDFPVSPEASMLVETGTVAPSVASSGFLPPQMASSGDLLTFAMGGFDEETTIETQRCAFTPLWLTHEQRYCRNVHLGAGVEGITGYSPVLDMSGVE